MHPTTTPSEAPAERASTRHGLRHAARHYLEMVLAMCAGMLVLGGAGTAVLGLLGLPTSYGPEIDSMLMATTMSAGMAVWMRYRGHGWVPVAEMCAAMYLPFVALFVPLWTATITPDGLMLWGHLLMLPAMAAVMLLRPREYGLPSGPR